MTLNVPAHIILCLSFDSERSVVGGGRASDAERMLFEVFSEAWYETQPVGIAAVQGAVNRQSAEMTQTGRARSVRLAEDDRQITTAGAVHEHAAAARLSAAADALRGRP